ESAPWPRARLEEAEPRFGSSCGLRELGMNRRVPSRPLVLDRKVAGVEMPASDLRRQRRILGATAVERLRTARAEVAPLRRRNERRRLPRDRSQPARTWPVEPSDRAEQPPGVR